jgi:esterase/lipase
MKLFQKRLMQAVLAGFVGINALAYMVAYAFSHYRAQGKQDRWTSMVEINTLFNNLKGSKQLVVFPEAGHQLLVTVDKERWQQNVDRFLSSLPSKS